MADELQIPEITPEVGERGSRDDQGLMYKGIVNVLRTMGILAGVPEQIPQRPKVIGDRYWIEAVNDGVFFPEVQVGQDVHKGEHLGVVRDYFGTILQEVTSPDDAKVFNLNWGMPVKKFGFLLWLGKI